MFRVAMIDRYALHDQYLTNQSVADYDKTIIPVAHPLVAINSHVNSSDKPSTIIVSLVLSDLDRENAAFIVNHAKEINELL